MKSFSKIVLTKFLFFLATSLMLISCGSSESDSGSNSTASSNNNVDVNSSDSINPPVVKPIPNEKVIYVCADGKSGADGSSWDNCKAEIQSAIKQAQDNNKDLWFKAGTYVLTETISIEKKDAKLYGGFKGTENELEGRKLVETSATILSGDGKIRVLKTENLSDKSVLDGFVITQGKLTQNNDKYGAGMHNTNSHITISNVTFSKNIVPHDMVFDKGGAMYNKSSNPTLTNVSFIENNSPCGSAIYNFQSSPTITNASFSKNESFVGVIENKESHPKIINATFSQNVSGSGVIGNHKSNSSFINVTFANTVADAAMLNNSDSKPIIKNSIIWNKKANKINYFENPNTPVITNSIIKGDSGNNGSQDPLLSEAKTKTINGVTHIYYELGSDSFAIDAGNNDDNNETTDQVGNNRKNGVIDIGAVEKQDLIF